MKKFLASLLFCLIAPALAAAAPEAVRIDHVGEYVFYEKTSQALLPSPAQSKLAVAYDGWKQRKTVEVIDLEMSAESGSVRHCMVECGDPEWINEKAFTAISNATGKRALYRCKALGEGFSIEESTDSLTTETLKKLKGASLGDLVEFKSETGGAAFYPQTAEPRKPAMRDAGPHEALDVRFFNADGHEWKPGDMLEMDPEAPTKSLPCSRGLSLEYNGKRQVLLEYAPTRRIDAEAGLRIQMERGLVANFIYDRLGRRVLIDGRLVYDLDDENLKELPQGGNDTERFDGRHRSYKYYNYFLIPGRESLLRLYMHVFEMNDGGEGSIDAQLQIVDLEGNVLESAPAYLGEAKRNSGQRVAACSRDCVAVQFSNTTTDGWTNGLMIFALR